MNVGHKIIIIKVNIVEDWKKNKVERKEER